MRGLKPRVTTVALLSARHPLRGVVLLRIDPGSGKLSVIDDFGPGGRIPGLDMNRADWPHGRTGPVRPHGAVFSLP